MSHYSERILSLHCRWQKRWELTRSLLKKRTFLEWSAWSCTGFKSDPKREDTLRGLLCGRTGISVEEVPAKVSTSGNNSQPHHVRKVIIKPRVFQRWSYANMCRHLPRHHRVARNWEAWIVPKIFRAGMKCSGHSMAPNLQFNPGRRSHFEPLTSFGRWLANKEDLEKYLRDPVVSIMLRSRVPRASASLRAYQLERSTFFMLMSLWDRSFETQLKHRRIETGNEYHTVGCHRRLLLALWLLTVNKFSRTILLRTLQFHQ